MKMSTKPNVIISTLDAERLEKIIDALPHSASNIAESLVEELARAEYVDPHSVPPTVVTITEGIFSNYEFRPSILTPCTITSEISK